MSAKSEVVMPAAPPALPNGSNLWMRQIATVVKLETRKNFWGVRSLLIYLLAAIPVAIMALTAIVSITYRTATETSPWRDDPNFGAIIFAGFYEGLILRTIVFFGCAWIFLNLFRGEVVDRSLHYYFLAPVRREVLLAGKYLSGLIAASVIFSLTTLISLAFVYLAGYPESMQNLHGKGISQAASYLGITILACVGYGAFFLLIGLFFRNPIVPAILLFGWEWLNFLLPPLLKKISVVHYLYSLEPISIPRGPFAVLAEPTPAYLSIPGLILVTLLALAVAAWRIRRMEIRYGGD
jgi:ABC-type transport system involved in multi-copper enzyme maturation permease subunit